MNPILALLGALLFIAARTGLIVALINHLSRAPESLEQCSSQAPDCSGQTGGVEVMVKVLSERKVIVYVYGLGAEKPLPTVELYHNGVGRAYRGKRRALADPQADERAPRRYRLVLPPPTPTTTHWLVRVVHARGIACAEFIPTQRD